MMNKMLSILLVSMLAITLSVCSENKTLTVTKTHLQKIVKKGELVLGTSGNLPPMTNAINDGKDVVGFDIDLATAMAKSMNVKLVIKVIPFDILIPALETGQIDMIISHMTITPERNTRVAFAGPYLTSGKCLVTKQMSLAAATKEDLESDTNKIVVLRGSTDEAFIKKNMPNTEAVRVDYQEDALKLLRNSEVSAMLSEFLICKEIVRNNPKDKFISSFSSLSYEPIGIAVGPQDTHLLNWVQNFLVRAKEDKLFEALKKKWFK